MYQLHCIIYLSYNSNNASFDLGCQHYLSVTHILLFILFSNLSNYFLNPHFAIPSRYILYVIRKLTKRETKLYVYRIRSIVKSCFSYRQYYKVCIDILYHMALFFQVSINVTRFFLSLCGIVYPCFFIEFSSFLSVCFILFAMYRFEKKKIIFKMALVLVGYGGMYNSVPEA